MWRFRYSGPSLEIVEHLALFVYSFTIWEIFLCLLSYFYYSCFLRILAQYSTFRVSLFFCFCFVLFFCFCTFWWTRHIFVHFGNFEALSMTFHSVLIYFMQFYIFSHIFCPFFYVWWFLSISIHSHIDISHFGTFKNVLLHFDTLWIVLEIHGYFNIFWRVFGAYSTCFGIFMLIVNTFF